MDFRLKFSQKLPRLRLAIPSQKTVTLQKSWFCDLRCHMVGVPYRRVVFGWAV